jgi:hypothetical protein
VHAPKWGFFGWVTCQAALTLCLEGQQQSDGFSFEHQSDDVWE